MSFKAIRYIMAAGLAMVTLMGAQAQLKLPHAHQAGHQQLLADQAKPTANFKLQNNNRLLEDIREREARNENDIYAKCWNSDRVNPYGSSVSIPEHKNLDVSGFHFPLKSSRVTSNYGYRSSFGRMHYGIDLALNVGDTVRAAFDGKVRVTRYEARGYGYFVVMRHDNGMETVYGHLSRFLVKPGQRVKAGDIIALGGNTGRSTGPHLHFETRYLGLPINPAAIVDFANKVPHRDVFAFNRATAGKAQNYGPSTPSTQVKKRVYAQSSKKSKRRHSRRRR